MLTNKEIEKIENKYLNKYFYFLKFAEDELLNWFKTRFRFLKVPNFELLENKPKRIKVIYFNKNMKDKFKNKLSFFQDIYNSQFI